METRKCTICQKEKPIEFFHKRKKIKRKSRCAECCNAAGRKYRTPEVKERLATIRKEKRKDEEYSRPRKDKENKKKREKRRSDPEYREKMLKREAQNREKGREQRREYDRQRKPLKNKLRRERYATDIKYKLTTNLRNRLLMALAGRNKASTTLNLLGCSIEEFKKHIENLWTEGMSWENHGSGEGGRHENCWHLDHIKSCAQFDLSDPIQQKECFHYSNIQPLWGKENLKKSWKFDPKSLDGDD